MELRVKNEKKRKLEGGRERGREEKERIITSLGGLQHQIH
jgi:hypothetical protein